MTLRWGSRSAKPARRARRLPAVATVLLVGLTALFAPVLVAGPVAAASGTGDVYVIQGIIGKTLDIYVDGKRVLGAAKAKTIVGPLALDAGTHQVALRDGGKSVASGRFRVGSGQSVDVIAHPRSDASMGAVVTAYRNDLAAVAPGKLRLAVAHTAAAPPADIRVNGDVLFSNVASGEVLTVTVPAGTYKVDIVPAATSGKAILGPVALPLRKGTLTRVFAIGSVANGSMDAVVHTLPVKVSGAAAPRSVPTGDGGQAATQFVGGVIQPADLLMAAALGLVGAAGAIGLAKRRRYHAEARDTVSL